MNKRPTTVSVTAWLLIVFGAISVISTIAMVNNPQAIELMRKSPMPISLQYAINYIGLTIMIVSGAGMLKGFNWSRLLYAVWGSIGFIIGAFTSPMKMMLIPGLVFFAIVIFFLFRPKANEFFKSAKTKEDAQIS